LEALAGRVFSTVRSLTLTQTASAGFAKISEMLFIVRNRDIAFGAIGNYGRPALAAKFWCARCIKAVIATRAQTIQSRSHPNPPQLYP
jgi:hypothetical protein